MSEAVSVTVSVPVSFKPLQVPNYAIHETAPRSRSEGFQDAPKTAIVDLPQEALDALAQRWLSDIYTKAGKRSPFNKSVFRGHDRG